MICYGDLLFGLRRYICLNLIGTVMLFGVLKHVETTQELTGQGANHKVFMDTDNLTDLTRLFAVVSSEVDTLVGFKHLFFVFFPWLFNGQRHTCSFLGWHFFLKQIQGYVGRCWHIISAHAEMVPG